MSLLSRKLRQRAGSDDPGHSDDDTSSPIRTRNGKNHLSPNPYSSENGGVSTGASAGYGSAPGVKLAQEIHDEFLVCKICLEGYKNPKCLTCLHTFCEQCIENHVNSESSYKKYSDYREFTCPLCRKRTQLPMGGIKKLPDNFLVSSLTEVVGRQKPSTYPFCDICKTVNRKQKEAKSKCLDCGKLLCSTCVDLHKETKVTASHSLFDVDIEKDIECKEHKDEVVRFYCEPCDACICVLCTFNEHKDHEITQFTDAVVKYKKSIGTLLEKCNEKISSFDKQVDALDKCEDIIKVVQQKVHDTAIEFIQDVRNKEKQLIEQLENIYGSECMERIVNKKNTTSQVESLRTTCNLTQVILSGKDIELLLLKRDVEEKLDSLSTVSIKSLPSTVNKVVEFVSGSVDFGYLHDHDRPLLSKMSKKFSRGSLDGLEYYQAAAAPPPPKSSTIETQTDPDITKLKARKPNSISSSSESSSSSSSSDSSDDSDSSDSDSDADDSDAQEKEEKTSVEVEVQTEKVEGADGWTMTEAVETEEKSVNTASLTAGGVEGSGSLNNSNEDLSDNSLAARRRRRRERAQTSYGGSSVYSSSPGEYQSLSSGQHTSMDDGYYDSSNMGSRYSMRH